MIFKFRKMEQILQNGIVYIERTDDTPEVTMDKNNLLLKICGPSFPEDAIDFYTPVVNWVKELGSSFTGTFVCELDFTILSSASNKMIFEILLLLEQLTKTGHKAMVKWYYESFDEDMYDEGRGFRDGMKVPFELIEK